MSLDLTMDLGSFSPGRLLSGGRRFILSIGDEAVVLTLLRRGQVEDAWVAAPDPAEGAADILTALAGHRAAPVSVLMDAFEQVFREEKVPRVGLLDQKKVINRHLHMAFPGNNLQAAMPHGQDPQGNRFYLFASIPPTEQVKGWLNVLTRAGRPPAGIHMLPLESLEMLRALTPRQQVQGVRWRMLFTFNMTGGLRQIVAKQSRLMLTRLTPPPPDDSSIAPVDIITRDYQQTLSYVKRMGYQRGDHLDLVVLAEEPLASALKAREWEAHNLTVLSPHMAGEPLGLGRVGQPGTPYADVLHAAFLGAKTAPKLSLRWAQAPAVDYRAQIIKLAPAAGIAASIGVAAAMGSIFLDKLETQDLIVREQGQLERARATLAAEQDRVAALDHAPDDVRRVIAVLERVSHGEIDPVPVFARLSAALGGQGVIRDMTLATADQDDPNARRGRRQQRQPTGPVRHTMELVVRLPVTVTTDADALSHAETLRGSLAGQFGENRVSITQPPVEVGGDQVLRGSRSGTPGGTATAAPEPYTVTYSVSLEGQA